MPRKRPPPVFLEDEVEFLDDHVPRLEAPQFNIAEMVDSLVEHDGPKAAEHAKAWRAS